MDQPNRQLSPPNLDLRHIQDHFEFTFPGIMLTLFSEGFSRPIFEPSTGTGRFSPSAVNLLPRFQHGSNTWVRLSFLTPERDLLPTPRCRDCTIAFRNCKSFLPKRNCRRTAPIDTTQRQLTIRSNQISISYSRSSSAEWVTQYVAWYFHMYYSRPLLVPCNSYNS